MLVGQLLMLLLKLWIAALIGLRRTSGRSRFVLLQGAAHSAHALAGIGPSWIAERAQRCTLHATTASLKQSSSW